MTVEKLSACSKSDRAEKKKTKGFPPVNWSKRAGSKKDQVALTVPWPETEGRFMLLLESGMERRLNLSE